MSLKEKLGNPPARRTCKFNVWVNTLSEEDSQVIFEALENRDWSLEKLTTALKDEDFPVNYDMIRKHRIKSCTVCFR
jgi:hypothetical protein